MWLLKQNEIENDRVSVRKNRHCGLFSVEKNLFGLIDDESKACLKTLLFVIDITLAPHKLTSVLLSVDQAVSLVLLVEHIIKKSYFNCENSLLQKIIFVMKHSYVSAPD